MLATARSNITPWQQVPAERFDKIWERPRV